MFLKLTPADDYFDRKWMVIKAFLVCMVHLHLMTLNLGREQKCVDFGLQSMSPTF